MCPSVQQDIANTAAQAVATGWYGFIAAWIIPRRGLYPAAVSPALAAAAAAAAGTWW
jgi:hypothetical protein